MVPQRLWKFDGEPGRYIAWKHSCLNVMNDINSTTFEQLDLLLNNLGQVCKVQCEDLRTLEIRKEPYLKYGRDWTWSMEAQKLLNTP